MSRTETIAAVDEDWAWYLSLADLKQAHGELLRRHRLRPDEELLDEVGDFIRRGRATGALLDAEEGREAAQSLLDYWATVLSRAGRELPDTTLADYDPGLAPELPDECCPYPGLGPIREAQADLFFGRRGLVEAGLERLRSGRMLVYLGPNGSGKSSLLRVGLVGALKAGSLPGSRDWRYPPPIAPGPDPIGALARLVPGADADDLREFRRTPTHLARRLDAGGGAPAVVVVDRFEEIFLLCRDDAARRMFVENLLGAGRSPGRHLLALAMRPEFVEQVMRMPSLRVPFERAQVPITPPSAAELREAIERPAERVGLRFGEGVVEGLIRDILGESEALPLLQFSLLSLWDHRDRNRITREAYRTLGGGRRSLVRAAEEFFKGLAAEDQDEARRLLLRLVRPEMASPGDPAGFPGADTGPVGRDALRDGGADPARTDRVLGLLARARLVRRLPGDRPGAEQFELVHRALVRDWPRMVDWLADKRIALSALRRLDLRAADWVRLGRGGGGLLDAIELREAERTLAGPEAAEFGVVPPVAELLQASRAAIEAADREREAVRLRELEQAHDLAREQARRADDEARYSRMLRTRAKFLAIAVAVAFVMAIIAAFMARSARQQATIARSRQFAAQSESRLIDQLDKAMEQGLEAHAISPTIESASSILTALQFSPRLRTYLRRPETSAGGSVPVEAAGASREPATSPRRPDPTAILDPVATRSFCVAMGRDGRRLAAGYPDGTIRVWEGLEGPSPRPFDLPRQEQAVTALAFGPDGGLASGGADGSVWLWTIDRAGAVARGPSPVPSPIGDATAVLSLAFGPALEDGGAVLASGGADGMIRLWRIGDGGRAEPLGGPAPGQEGEAVRCVAFSPNGRMLASGGGGNDVLLWDVLLVEQDVPRLSTSPTAWLVGHREAVLGVAFSPNGQMLASGGEDNAVILWGVGGVQPRMLGQPMIEHDDDVTAVAFGGDGTVLASAGADEVVLLWEVPARAPIEFAATLRGHTEAVTGLAFAPDGRALASVGADSAAILWDVEDIDHVPPLGEVLVSRSTAIRAVAFLEAGRLLASAGDSGSIVFWDVEREALAGQPPLVGHNRPVSSLAHSPASGLLASGDIAGSVVLWDASDPRRPVRVATLRAGEGDREVTGLAFCPDGVTLAASLVAAGSRREAGPVLLWDVGRPGDPRPLGTPRSAAPMTAWGVAFAPDGRTLAIASEDGSVYLSTRGEGSGSWSDPAPLPGDPHTLGVHSVAFAPDGRTLASGGWDSTVRIWDVAGRGSAPTIVLAGHLGDVRSVAFAGKDGGRLASGSVDKTVILWDLRRREMIGTPLVGHTDGVRGLAFDPEGEVLASGSWDSSVILWKVPDGGADGRVEPIGGRLYDEADKMEGLALSPDGAWLATDDIARGVNLYRLAGGESPARPPSLVPIDPGGDVGPVRSVVFAGPAPRSRAGASGDAGPLHLVAGGIDGTIHLWSLGPGGQWGHEVIEPTAGEAGRSVRSLAFAPDGRTLASGWSDGGVILWGIDASPRRPVLLPGAVASDVLGLAISRDGRFLAAGMADGRVALWRLDRGGDRHAMLDHFDQSRHGKAVRTVAFSGDARGTILATGGDDGYVYLWRVDDSGARSPLFDPLKGHKDEVFSVAFSPDGRTLATGGGDRTIRLWDVATGQAVGRPLLYHRLDVTEVVFQDDATLFSGSEDGSIVRWDVGVGRWKDRISRILGGPPAGAGGSSRAVVEEAR